MLTVMGYIIFYKYVAGKERSRRRLQRKQLQEKEKRNVHDSVRSAIYIERYTKTNISEDVAMVPYSSFNDNIVNYISYVWHSPVDPYALAVNTLTYKCAIKVGLFRLFNVYPSIHKGCKCIFFTVINKCLIFFFIFINKRIES